MYKIITIISFFTLLIFIISPNISHAQLFEQITYDTDAWSIDIPSVLNRDEVTESLLSFSNDAFFIQVQEFYPDLSISDRDEFLNQEINEARENCESNSFEEDQYRCVYELLDSYKIVIQGNPTLVIFDQSNLIESLDSVYVDSIERCYVYYIIEQYGVMKLLGCVNITNQELAEPLMDSLGMAFGIDMVKSSLDSFTFKDLSLNVESFVDSTKDPSYYVGRYQNEPEYKKWFDENFPNITIYEAIGIPPRAFLTSNPTFPVENKETPILDDKPIPDWVKNIAGFWSEGKISDDEFKAAIKFLVDSGIIVLE